MVVAVVVAVAVLMVLFTFRVLVGLSLGRTDVGTVARLSDQTLIYSDAEPVFFVNKKKFVN